MRAPKAQGARFALGAVFLLLCGCSAYDSDALPTPTAGAPQQGTGGAFPPVGEPGGGGRDGGSAGSDAAAGDGAVPADAGADAAVGCMANPGAGACPEICPEVCNGQDDDCDGDVDEADAADAYCAADHAISVCQRGACRVVECLDEYRDCDRDAMTGCETSLEDPNHCGQCGQVCSLENAIAGCQDGECIAIGCEPGHGDCDGDGQSCETKLASLEHCGACDTSCGGLDRASPQCDTGACGVLDCLGNFGDCNGEPGDGCETPLNSLQHCGACDTPCAKASCGGGVCTAVTCADPTADCDQDEIDCEVDLTSDIDHCGGCGVACAFQTATPRAMLSCVSRDCQAMCDAGYGDCDENYASGCETALGSTPAHCGGCGNNCTAMLPHTATTSCTSGTCGVVTCESGWEDCDGVAANGCERSVAAEGPCFPDTNCTRQTHGGHEYFFCRNTRTWAGARDRCRRQTRGDLVNIGSSAENAFVMMHRTADAWIGARDAAIEGLWRWENNGVPFWRGTSTGAAVLSQYANWGSPQPDDWQGNEDCAEIWVDGKWNDGGCSNSRAFVCEVSPDECETDANKIDPGQCGCGVADTDSDGDGFANCVETCDDDPNKQSPGACGCGVADTDSDGDGTPDCNDLCPADPTRTAACLGFTPTHFDPNPINWSAQPVATLGCNGTTTVNTTDPDGSGPLVATITNWCGTAPVPIVQAQSGGPAAVIIPLRGLSVPSGTTLRLLGTRPVVFAVDGDVNIAGMIDANANGASAGAGGNWSCGGSAGGNGSGSSSLGSGGGGGGGFGTAGGRGGDGGGGSPGAVGTTRGNTNISVLFGGCNGGQGGGCSASGAAGGGAVQITASGTLTATGTLRANGGIGTNGCGSEGGGAGGGSGGAIFLEAGVLSTGSATLQVNGGRGGAGAGGPSGGNGSTSSGSNGSNGGNDCCNGGSGAGGGYGRIRLLDR